jgi:hypothetical protein
MSPLSFVQLVDEHSTHCRLDYLITMFLLWKYIMQNNCTSTADVGASHSEPGATQSALTMAAPTSTGSRAA